MFPDIDNFCQSHFFINSFTNRFSPIRSSCVLFLGIKAHTGINKPPATDFTRANGELDTRRGIFGIAEQCLSL